MCGCRFVLHLHCKPFWLLLKSSSTMPGEYLKPEGYRVEKKKKFKNPGSKSSPWLSSPTPHTNLSPWMMFVWHGQVPHISTSPTATFQLGMLCQPSLGALTDCGWWCRGCWDALLLQMGASMSGYQWNPRFSAMSFKISLTFVAFLQPVVTQFSCAGAADHPGVPLCSGWYILETLSRDFHSFVLLCVADNMLRKSL